MHLSVENLMVRPFGVIWIKISKITQIIVHQRSRWIHDLSDFGSLVQIQISCHSFQEHTDLVTGECIMFSEIERKSIYA